MKKIVQIGFLAIAIAFGFNANAQQLNIVNQYGPPTFTGGTVASPSENFALYQEQQVIDNPVTAIASIYPDPAQNVSSITLSEVATKPVRLYIVNLNGTIIQTLDFDGGSSKLTFDVSALQNGVYTIQVQEEGKSMQSIKLLKQS